MSLLALTGRSPANLLALPAERESHAMELATLLQKPQVETHHIPTNHHVWIEHRKPIKETFNQRRFRGHILKIVQRLV